MTLSNGEIAIQWMKVNKPKQGIRWTVIDPVGTVIQISNNPGLGTEKYCKSYVSWEKQSLDYEGKAKSYTVA